MMHTFHRGSAHIDFRVTSGAQGMDRHNFFNIWLSICIALVTRRIA